MRSHLFYHLRRTSCAALPLLIGAALSLSHPVTARADEATPLPPVSVDTDKMPAGCPLDTTSLDKKQVNAKSILGASDSVGMLSAVPGVSVIPNGGIAGLPIIHGIADDQNSTLVDGVPITSSCPNHMNPAQAYIAPSNVGHVTVISGVSPVSAGGDSIGGTILIDPAAPMFANPGENVAVHGSAGTFFAATTMKSAPTATSAPLPTNTASAMPARGNAPAIITTATITAFSPAPSRTTATAAAWPSATTTPKSSSAAGTTSRPLRVFPTSIWTCWPTPATT